jgi:CDP-paratose 2-epimerase
MTGRPPIRLRAGPVLITGGAGFIGCNLADRLARQGYDVLVLDALARRGVEANLAWLRRRHPRRVTALIADIRDERALSEATAQAIAVFHLAAQVAVTTSLIDPYDDFDVNIRGTVLLLDQLRRRANPPPLVFASTNKVYGDLGDVALADDGEAYLPQNPELRAYGVDERRPLCFHTPYGCSKGAADQYVLDYARSFGLPAAVLRMSCIYGPRQFGTEDQGWVAHFLRCAIAGQPITIYGDGRQVRDVLHVDDAVSAYLAVWGHIREVAGQAFNLGGGPANAITLRELLGEIERIIGRPVQVRAEGWRSGDQRYFVADTRRAAAALALDAPMPWRRGIGDLVDWIRGEGVAAAALATGGAPVTVFAGAAQ